MKSAWKSRRVNFLDAGVWRRQGLAIGLLGLLAALSYWPSLANGFCFDDRAIVLENPVVREGLWAEALSRGYWEGATGDRAGLYRPLTVLFLTLEFHFFGEWMAPYHVVNIALHTLCAVMLCLCARCLLSDRDSLLAAAAFAVHPGISEAVNAVVGAADIMAAIFGMGALLVLERRAVAHGPMLAGGLAAALLLASQLAKESGVIFAIAILARGLIDSSYRGRAWSVAILGAMAGPAVKLLVTGAVFPPAIGFIDNPLAYCDGLTRMANGVGLAVSYLHLLAFPWPLSADYSFAEIPVVRPLWTARLLAPVLLTTSLVFLTLRVRRRVALQWVAVTTSGIILVANILFPIGTIFAERLAYIPATGLSVGFGWCLGRLVDGRLTSRSASAARLVGWRWLPLAWVLIGATLTHMRAYDWRDDHTLFAAASQVTPGSARSHFGLGLALQREGELEPALAAYAQALQVYPRYAEAHYNAGAARLAQGQSELALRSFREAIRSRPAYAEAQRAHDLLSAQLSLERPFSGASDHGSNRRD